MDQMCQSKDTEWQIGLKEQKITIGCLQQTHFTAKDTHRLKVREWKKILHENGNNKKAGLQYSYQTKLTLKQRP